MRHHLRSRSVFAFASVALVAFAVACGSSDDDGGLATDVDAGAADGGASTTDDSGAGPGDAGGGKDAGDGGEAEAGPLTPALSVSPATTSTIVSGSPVVLTATLVSSADAIAWTLFGPGTIDPPTGPTTTYTPPASGAVGVATITATAGAITANASVRVSSPPKRSIVAYAWANASGAASYTPSASYSYNAAGGAITATRSAVGVYAMKFADLPLASGDVQVTAYQSNARCNVESWSSDTAHVECVDPAGAPVDSLYTIAVSLDGVPSVASTAAYVLADSESSASYTPSPAYSYNAGGGAISVTRSAAGSYAVSFGGLTTGSGDVQVSAYGSDRTCNVNSWSGSVVNVRCYDKDGSLADSKYTVAVVLNDVHTTTNVAAYAWADDPSAASYTPNATYAYNASGGAITAKRSAAGTYEMSFSGLNLARGSVKVSAYGSDRQCNVQLWSGSSVQVRCYDKDGALADSRYTVLFTTDHRPVRSRVGGYAWASNASAASYSAAGLYGYNAKGGAITATRSAVGTYTMAFAGLDLGGGDVQVTAYGGAAHCNVANWSGSAVDVRCYDKTGALADSRYVVTAYVDDQPTTADTVAYARANDPASASYTPSAEYRYNAGGGAVTATRSATGTYAITFAGLTLDSGAVHVSGYGGTTDCNVDGWNDSTVDVRCFDGNGNLADSQYTVSVVLNDTLSSAVSPAYAWTDAPSSANYAPDGDYAYNASGSPMFATRSGVGEYTVNFVAQPLDRGHVKVSAYDSSARCSVLSWAGGTVSVRCFGAGGTPADTSYTVLYTE